MKPAKLAAFSLLLVLLLPILSGMTKSFRFGNTIIEVGQTKSEVYSIIGEPINRQVVGFIESPGLNGNEKITVFIEVWTISVDWYGEKQYYDLIFFGERLDEIIWLRNIDGS